MVRVCLIVLFALFRLSSGVKWVESSHLNEWLTKFDLCLLKDSRNVSIDIISKDCEQQVKATDSNIVLPPIRCRIGNTWPSRSQYCDPQDIPFTQRANLRNAVEGYDDPNSKPLERFFRKLSSKNGLLLLIGDSVMQQFFSALACELEREKIWPDPSLFTNTDEARYVKFTNTDGSTSATMATVKFVPIYHLVNGRYDRQPNASMHHLQHTMRRAIENHRTIVILINMGLHYVDNPVAGFSKQDYIDQMIIVLTYLNKLAATHNGNVASSNSDSNDKYNIRIIWRETTAQHFPTKNGYWPGVRYAAGMKVGCRPLEDPSPAADWRNRAIEQIIKDYRLQHVNIARFYDLTAGLWSEHPNGHLRDCTHFCWTPWLYQPLFQQLDQSLPSVVSKS